VRNKRQFYRLRAGRNNRIDKLNGFLRPIGCGDAHLVRVDKLANAMQYGDFTLFCELS